MRELKLRDCVIPVEIINTTVQIPMVTGVISMVPYISFMLQNMETVETVDIRGWNYNENEKPGRR